MSSLKRSNTTQQLLVSSNKKLKVRTKKSVTFEDEQKTPTLEIVTEDDDDEEEETMPEPASAAAVEEVKQPWVSSIPDTITKEEEKQLMSLPASALIVNPQQNYAEHWTTMQQLYHDLGCYRLFIGDINKDSVRFTTKIEENKDPETKPIVPHYVSIKGNNYGARFNHEQLHVGYGSNYGLPMMQVTNVLLPPYGTMNARVFAPKINSEHKASIRLILRQDGYIEDNLVDGYRDHSGVIAIEWMKQAVESKLCAEYVAKSEMGVKANMKVPWKTGVEYDGSSSIITEYDLFRKAKTPEEILSVSVNDELMKHCRTRYIGQCVLRAPKQAYVHETKPCFYKVVKTPLPLPLVVPVTPVIPVIAPAPVVTVPVPVVPDTTIVTAPPAFEYGLQEMTWQEVNSIEDGDLGLATISPNVGFNSTGGSTFGPKWKLERFVWFGSVEKVIQGRKKMTVQDWKESAQIPIPRFTDKQFYELKKENEIKEERLDIMKATEKTYTQQYNKLTPLP